MTLIWASLERSLPPAEVGYIWCQFWSKAMTSEEDERPRFVTGGYGWHRRQWVKMVKINTDSMISQEIFLEWSSNLAPSIKVKRGTKWYLLCCWHNSFLLVLSKYKLKFPVFSLTKNHLLPKIYRRAFWQNRNFVCSKLGPLSHF